MTEINQVSRQRPLSVVFPAKAGIQELSRKVRAPEWIPAFAGKTGEGRTNDNWCTGMLLKDTICSVYSNTSCPPSLNGYAETNRLTRSVSSCIIVVEHEVAAR
jgi:hypothetical protein